MSLYRAVRPSLIRYVVVGRGAASISWDLRPQNEPQLSFAVPFLPSIRFLQGQRGDVQPAFRAPKRRFPLRRKQFALQMERELF